MNISFICIVLLSTTEVFGDSRQLSPAKKQLLDDFITSLMQCRNIVGVSLAMVHNGETVFADGFGFRDLENKLKMQADTKISIGSITKSFTTALAAEAVGQGLTTWDTPLKDYVPDFELEGEFRTQETSLRDLFSHRIGIPSYYGFSTAHVNITRKELVRRMRYFPVLFNFRSKFKYANYPFIIGSWATQVLTGQAWEEHVKNTLLEPLGMEDTKICADLEDEDWQNLALSYSYDADQNTYIKHPDRDQMPHLTAAGPSGGIFASARDMAKYMKFHLRDGQNEAGEELIPLEALRATYHPVIARTNENPRTVRPQFPIDSDRITYAQGWSNGVYRGHVSLGHSGVYSGYMCRLRLLRDSYMGVFVCVNSPGNKKGYDAVKLINMFAMDLLLDVEPALNETTGCTFPSPWFPTAYAQNNNKSLTSLFNISMSKMRDLSDYVGIYSHPGFGEFNVFLNESDGVLYYSYGTLLSGRLKKTEYSGKFLMTLNHPFTYIMQQDNYPSGFPVQFGDSADGKVVEKIQVFYLEKYLPPVFTRKAMTSNGFAGKAFSWKLGLNNLVMSSLTTMLVLINLTSANNHF